MPAPGRFLVIQLYRIIEATHLVSTNGHITLVVLNVELDLDLPPVLVLSSNHSSLEFDRDTQQLTVTCTLDGN